MCILRKTNGNMHYRFSYLLAVIHSSPHTQARGEAMLNNLVKVFLSLAIAATYSTLAEACGKERWAVKTVIDKDMARVDPAPIPTNISKLTGIDAPINPNLKANNRYAPTELSIYEITGTLTLIKSEADGDYHMVIKDEKGRTMIIEAADPECAKDSRFASEIIEVRNAIDQEMGGAVRSEKHLSKVVTVTGVGFFDLLHGQTGVAPNGIELHPVVSIVFHKEPTVMRYRSNVQMKRKEEGGSDVGD